MSGSSGGAMSLNGTWELAWTEDFPDFAFADDLPGRCVLPAAVPASIHQVLMDAGMLDDPRVGMNSLRARWVEEQTWVYRRDFTVPDEAVDKPAWLVFDRLEYEAVVKLNGEIIGEHANAHRPARFDVTGKLRAGENRIVVRCDTGLVSAADKPGGEYRMTPQARLTKIHWHRKGQWQRGWDWQARLLNVGILGDVRLEWSDQPIIEQAQIYALPSDDLQTATLHAWFTLNNPKAEPVSATLYLHTVEAADAAQFGTELSISVPAGISRHEVTFTIENPRLWWPVGHGEPYLYGVVAAVIYGKDECLALNRRVGVRKVAVDQSPHPETGKHFILKINDRPIFCKGGNWVPADMLYSTVTAERYQELAQLALDANFNLLRIWGGGIFADPALLDFCDANGILVWHDLLFACSKYPGDHPEFAAEVTREVTWAVREMAHHASLVVWCGNNEIEEGDWNWSGQRDRYRVAPHYALFHRDLPRIVTREDPGKFYWISSPYSPDYANPTDPTVGDQHPWGVSLQKPGGADWWDYRKYVDRFPNEGGVLGCVSPATLREFLPENERYLFSPSWEHHDNPFAINDSRPGSLGHAYQTVQLWTGRDPLTMDWEEYAFASALLQAEGISEYITNYRRRMFSSASAVFWMYNDSWPATHSWTIVDYYRRKKLAFHPVRRAFAPITVVVAEDTDGKVRAYGINDTPIEWSGALQFGIFAVNQAAGEYEEPKPVTLPANASVELAVCDAEAAGQNSSHGVFAVLRDLEGRTVAQRRLFLARFGDLTLEPEPSIELRHENGLLTLTSAVFAWGVCLDVDGERPLSDNGFDLLPGVPYTLPWDRETLGEPRIVRIGNWLFKT